MGSLLPGETDLSSYNEVIDAADVHGWPVELEYQSLSSSWCLTIKNCKRHGGQRLAQAFGVEAAPEVFERLGERMARKLRL